MCVKWNTVFSYLLDTQVPVVPYWRLPGLGIIVYLLKQSASDFFSYYDSHRRSLNKLQNVEQLPPDEIKEVWTCGTWSRCCTNKGPVWGLGSGVKKIDSVLLKDLHLLSFVCTSEAWTSWFQNQPSISFLRKWEGGCPCKELPIISSKLQSNGASYCRCFCSRTWSVQHLHVVLSFHVSPDHFMSAHIHHSTFSWS